LRDASASETIASMPRLLVRAAVALLAFCLLAPAARADGLGTLQDLAKRHLRPAPLVPTSAPRPMSDLSVSLDQSYGGRGKRGYALRLAHYASGGPDAIIALERGGYPSVRAAVRVYRRGHYRVRRTRLRGRPAFVLTSKAGVRESLIFWREDKSVYSLATGTTKKVSLRSLRATASGLDHLGANYLGSFFAEGSDNTSLDAMLVTTQRFVSGTVEWGTDNCTFNGGPGAAHGATANFIMLPLRAGAFSLPLNGPLVTRPGWIGTLSGTVSPGAIDVALQGTGTFDDQTTCDTGPMSVSAERRDPI
jgi:hypothetical protein